MNGEHDLMLTIIAVVAIMSLLLIVAAIGYAVGGANAPKRDDEGNEVEAVHRTGPRRSDPARFRR